MALCALFLTDMAWASFQISPVSIKAQAMGGAFVALADDAGAIFTNPAGLVNLAQPEVSFMYGSPYSGLEGFSLQEGYLALGAPFGGNWGLGLGGTMFSAPGILSEYQLAGSLSRRLGPYFAAGASATYLYHDYQISEDPLYAQEPVFANGSSKGAVGLDLGLTASPTQRLRFGFSARHLNRPDVGLLEKDPVGRELRFGLFYRFRYAGLLADLEERDNGMAQGASRESTWRLGLEVPIKSVALRAGANNNAVTAGLGLGLGYLRLDYAFALLNKVEAQNLGTQLVALSLQFGRGRDSGSAHSWTRLEWGKNAYGFVSSPGTAY